MNINKRLSNIESVLNKAGDVVCRLAGSNGDYPEREDDIRESRQAIVISVPGVSCEELRGWAK